MDPFMQVAYNEALRALHEGGAPIGAVLVHDSNIIGRGRDRRIQTGSVLKHAEVDCIENAGRQPKEVYKASTLYCTLSPCPLCSGAIIVSHIGRVVVGDDLNYNGNEDYLRAMGVAVEAVNEPEIIRSLGEWISGHPDDWLLILGEK
jgi:cytosine deaminase